MYEACLPPLLPGRPRVALYLQKLLFHPFPPSLSWLALASPLFIFLSLPLPILRLRNFMQSLATARKRLIRFRKLSRSTMTWSWQEDRCMRLSKGKVRETCGGWSEKSRCKGFRHRNRHWSGEWLAASVMTHSGSWCRLKQFMPLSTRIYIFQRSWPGEWPK